MTVKELKDILENEDGSKKVRLLFEKVIPGTGELEEVLTEVSSVLVDDVAANSDEEFCTLIYGEEVVVWKKII